MAVQERHVGANPDPVIAASSCCLAHVPDLVPLGSKPRREIGLDAGYAPRLRAALRSFEDAAAYPPNQTFIGNLSPEDLGDIPRPWFDTRDASPSRQGPFGEIIPQGLFHAALARANVLEPPLVELADERAGDLQAELAGHEAFSMLRGDWSSAPAARLAAECAGQDAVALYQGDELCGLVRRDERAEGRDDANLDALTLLEALCSKTSGALAVADLLHRHGLEAADVDFLISCGEEAAGDRYQRGGGGMAKAIGELTGCVNASGMDVKNFCAAPASALVTAGALVSARVFERVVVVGGGSLAKLGMKSPAFLAEGIPVLDDCLGAVAFLVTADDGVSPRLRIASGAIGRARIGASTSDETVYRQLILEPLAALGLTMTDVDRFAPELHNPEIMEHSGSGDVVTKNYRMIAATAVRANLFSKAEMGEFIRRVGMTGFAPTQGHIPSGVPYIAHAAAAMRRGELSRVMFLCKASLFLNRITALYDGLSFVLERQSIDD